MFPALLLESIVSPRSRGSPTGKWYLETSLALGVLITTGLAILCSRHCIFQISQNYTKYPRLGSIDIWDRVQVLRLTYQTFHRQAPACSFILALPLVFLGPYILAPPSACDGSCLPGWLKQFVPGWNGGSRTERSRRGVDHARPCAIEELWLWVKWGATGGFGAEQWPGLT